MVCVRILAGGCVMRMCVSSSDVVSFRSSFLCASSSASLLPSSSSSLSLFFKLNLGVLCRVLRVTPPLLAIFAACLLCMGCFVVGDCMFSVFCLLLFMSGRLLCVCFVLCYQCDVAVRVVCVMRCCDWCVVPVGSVYLYAL